MRNVILLAKDKASRLSDEELGAEIEKLSSDPKAKLRLKDERGCRLDLTPMVLAVLKDELATRRNSSHNAVCDVIVESKPIKLDATAYPVKSKTIKLCPDAGESFGPKKGPGKEK